MDHLKIKKGANLTHYLKFNNNKNINTSSHITIMAHWNTFWNFPMTKRFRLLQGVYICHVNDVLQIIDSYSRNRKSWRSRFPSWFVTCMTASWRNRPSRNIGESVFLIRLDDFGQISTNKNRSLRISDKYRINQYLSIY